MSEYLGITEPQVMIHRVDAHDYLRKFASSFPNFHLHLGRPVSAVDPEHGTATFADGSTTTGDVIIGSDGIHSTCVAPFSTPSNPQKVHRMNINVYRMLVPAKLALADPDIRALLQGIDWPHNLTDWHDKQKRGFVIYACRDAELLNIVGFVRPEMDTDNIAPESYHAPGSKAIMHKAYEGWPDHFHKIIDLAEEDEIIHWTVGERDVPDSFHKGRLVLIGDAAHPMPPTHTAGATVGVEEAAALGAMFTEEITAEQVPAVLEIFNQLWYKYATTIKYSSNSFYNMRHDRTIREALWNKIKERCGPDAIWPTDEEVQATMWTHNGEQEARQAMVRAGLHKSKI